MTRRNWRATVVAVLSAAIINTGAINAAQAGIVGTDTMVQSTNRAADLATIQQQLSREEVRDQFTKLGVDADSLDQRINALSDSELSAMAKRMQEAPAGGDGLVALLGVVFVVLLVLELVGVIDIFKRIGPAR
jgi:hypothetical protein